MPLVLAALCVCPIAPPGLPDPAEFGLCRGLAGTNYKATYAHADLMRAEVQAWNSPDHFAAWRAELDWRRRVWDYAARAMDGQNWWPPVCPAGAWRLEKMSPDARRAALAELRGLIGDAAFYGRRLPSPFPHYRLGPQD